MKAEEYQELKALFLALRDVGVDERTRLIERHCGDDAEKRRELERLLEAHDRSGDPLGADSPGQETADISPGRPAVFASAVGRGGYSGTARDQPWWTIPTQPPGVARPGAVGAR